jgi:hypothetical protein
MNGRTQHHKVFSPPPNFTDTSVLCCLLIFWCFFSALTAHQHATIQFNIPEAASRSLVRKLFPAAALVCGSFDTFNFAALQQKSFECLWVWLLLLCPN